MDLLGGEVRDGGGYVFVRNPSVPDERRARQILAAVDDALRKSGHRGVLFDTRDMAAPSESVNAILRWWVDAGRLHDKVALLVKSDLKRIASNMRALSVGVKMRSFHELGEAEAWLRKPVPIARPAQSTEAVVTPLPGPYKITIRGRDADSVASATRDAAAGKSGGKSAGTGKTTPRGRTASKDTDKDQDEPLPASRWRSPLLRGIGSGNKT